MKSQKNLVIIGAGGFGREVLDVIEAIHLSDGPVECIGFVVDSQYGEPGTIINELPILGDMQWLVREKVNVQAVCSIASPHLRYRVIKQLEVQGITFGTLIHPNAIMTPRVSIGVGSVITAGCILTTNIATGQHVHLNLDCDRPE